MDDAVVVGSGPNGLAAAVTLARAGVRVTVLEAEETVGGGARTLDLGLAPGLLHDVCSAVHPMAWASPFFRAFDLAARGVELLTPEVAYAQPLDGRPAAVAFRDLARTVERLGADGGAWRGLVGAAAAQWEAVVGVGMGDKRSLPPGLGSPGALLGAARFGLGVLEQGTPLWDLRWRTPQAAALLTGVAAHAIAPLPSLGGAGTALLLAALAHAGSGVPSDGGAPRRFPSDGGGASAGADASPPGAGRPGSGDDGGAPRELLSDGGAPRRLPSDGGAPRELPSDGGAPRRFPSDGGAPRELPSDGGAPRRFPSDGGGASAGADAGLTASDGGWPIPRGGSQAITDALVRDLRAHGGDVVTGHRVTSRADLPAASAYLFDTTPRTLLAVLGDDVPPAGRRRLTRFRHGAAAAKVDFVLSGPVPWADPDGDGAVHRAGTVHLGGTREQMVRAEAEVHAGRHAERPMVLVSDPAVVDPGREVGGLRPLWTYAHVPAGSTVDVTEAITAQLERFAPGFRDVVVASRCTPAARLADHNPNYVGGDIAGGAVTMWQLIARPTPAANPYRVNPHRAGRAGGVYLCSASTPPGPGVHGMSGYHAARRALREVFGVRIPAL